MIKSLSIFTKRGMYTVVHFLFANLIFCIYSIETNALKSSDYKQICASYEYTSLNFNSNTNITFFTTAKKMTPVVSKGLLMESYNQQRTE